MYHKLAGMTGTAETEASEFWSIYKLDVVAIPTNRPVIRDDRQDLIYKTKREKYNAVIEEIVRLVGEGRPVLVGTTSVEISELLSRMLKLRGIKHNVLNAKQHQLEAQVVAEAGRAGQVTIATNMAGRGTDSSSRPRSRRPEVWPSSVPSATKAAVSTGSCAAVPAARATRVLRSSSSRWRTT